MGSTVQQAMVPDSWYFYGSYPCLLHGGYYNQCQYRGPFYVYCSRASVSSDLIGCRILAKPQANPPFGSRGSSPFLYRTVDRTALAEEKAAAPPSALTIGSGIPIRTRLHDLAKA